MEVTSSKDEVQESAQHTTWTSVQKQKMLMLYFFGTYFDVLESKLGCNQNTNSMVSMHYNKVSQNTLEELIEHH